MNRILVIVVTWNSAGWVDRCLGSLRESTVPVDALVVDNASTDGTPDAIEQKFPEVELLRLGENYGFGAANNVGLRLALGRGYDYVYLLNSDAWLLPDTLEKMLAAANGPGSGMDQGAPAGGSESFGILSPVQVDASLRKMDARFEKKCGKALARAGYALSASGSPVSDDAVVPVMFVMAAHWLISHDALERVGEFSASFDHYGEDDNYIDRLHYHGLNCGVVPGALAVHDRAARSETKAGRMRLKCVSTVVKISNPCKWLPWMMIREPLELIGMAVKNFSIAPLRFLPGFLGRYPALLRERRATCQPGYRSSRTPVPIFNNN